MTNTYSFDPTSARATPPVAALPDRACKGVDVSVFYPEHSSQYDEARKICFSCPHIQPCLLWALETRQMFGVWGSTSPDERRLLLARMPSVARPVEPKPVTTITVGSCERCNNHLPSHGVCRRRRECQEAALERGAAA